MATKAQSSLPPPPADWPPQADSDYERIRILGAGAFGEVWLARARVPDENGARAEVAIKGVSIEHESEGATAEREMAILRNLNHPNIIRLLHDYAPASDEAKGRYMALSYVNGPDIGQLLEERGALGLPLARIIARDLIAAVAYCHARGVIHRDIKPDNVMLEGCMEGKKWLFDDVMWNDDVEMNQLGRFKAVLADFGFARATTEADYQTTTPAPESRRASFDRHKSMMVFSRAKSAVGTKFFAAPEITKGVRLKSEGENALTSCVSSYALISDAYAVGVTLKEIVTGAPPGQDVTEYVKANRKVERPNIEPKKQQSSFSRLRKRKLFLRKLLTRSAASERTKPSSETATLRSELPHDIIQLRYMTELPEQVQDLIDRLTEEKMDERLSVRRAQDHEWIGGYDSLPQGDTPSHHFDPIVYIKDEAALL